METFPHAPRSMRPLPRVGDVISISRVAPDQYDAPADGSVASGTGSGVEAPAEAVRRIAASATAEDGSSPLDEATVLALRHRGLAGKSLWLARDDTGRVTGFALAEEADDHVALHLVVDPPARRTGVGGTLAREALDALPGRRVTVWSHGNHPAAARLADALGLVRVRDLWVMRRPLSEDAPLPLVAPAGGIVVRPFVPGRDEEAFLAVNAEAFVGHPEQGRMTRADLEERMAEPWFDPEGFFLAEPADAPAGAEDAVESPALLGFHWTKTHDERVGEVYVVGISPAAQGRGLGRLLTLTGLHHLARRGLAEVILYVEADNAPAVAVYSGLGFTHADTDTHVMYERRPEPAAR